MFGRTSRPRSKGLRTAAWALALSTAFAVGSVGEAHAQSADGEIPVVVLTAGTLDAFEQADIFTNALKLALKKTDGWEENKLPKDQALLFLTSSLACNDPPDAACEQKIGDELKVDSFVWATVRREGDKIAGELHLWVRGQASKSAPFAFPVTTVVAGDPAFVDEVEKTFISVAGPAPNGRVILHIGKLDGDIEVDGKSAGKLVGGTATVEIPRGSHRITIEIDGYETVETTVELKVREQRDVTLSPVAKTSTGAPIQKILGFTAIGIGVAAAGVATYAGVRVLQINSGFAPYREENGDPTFFFRPPEGDTEFDGCAREGDTYPNIQQRPNTPSDDKKLATIQDDCAEGSTMQTLTLAFWPIAGAFAGAGIILLATADWSGKPSTEKKAELPFLLVPNFGPTGGDVTFATRF